MTTAELALESTVPDPAVRAPWVRRLAGRRGLALLLVVAADVFLWRAPLGWSAALLGWSVLLVLAVAGGLKPRTWPLRGLYLLAVVQVGTLAVHPSPLRLGLAALAIVATAFADRQGFTWAGGLWIRRLVLALPGFVSQPFVDLAQVAEHQRRPGRRPVSWGSPRSWILPLGLGLFFVLLFTVANPLIDRWFSTAFTRLRTWLEAFEWARVGLWTLAGMAAWGLLRLRRRRERHAANVAPGRAAAWALAPAALTRCLLVLNLVFLLQNALDVSYLWLGRALPEGLTYAEYAQRGAYPLLVAALLAAAFVLLTFRAGPDPGALRGPRRWVVLFLAQNVLLTAAALRRLALYVDAYSLTRWRVAAGLWMLLVAVGLVLVAVRILRHRSNTWLVRRCALAALLFLVGASWMPLDRWIADFNVAHSAELAGPGHVRIDLGYLRGLGSGALPALDRLSAEAADPLLESQARQRARAEREAIAADLRDWRGWTLRRALLARTAAPRER